MPFKKIEWSEKLSIEISLMDQQHHGLIDLFNDFLEAVETEQPVAALCDLFEKIITDAKAHFRCEEQLMMNINYSSIQEHKRHHAQLLSDAVDIFAELKKAHSSKEIHASVLFLRALVLKHLGEQDMQIKSFLLRGIEP
ncbi:putative Hemerythrin-like metal-binding domain-containing protein [Candidatus Terasakiella magnetica]|uniref:Putative Hemerythrin-like metal-binding domain-containing protein n=1 Tax=Candidatus Terasakiella magnetica TaxID=1867952 RepID=A0A1C3RI17_9PROT|nr:hemerythrin family protein [Candidatus Terasakiella magnetica]SCA56917.1 putative Hemerythrin-like metal-binding domain-containing protein [Candidatus Terasakiella magnetica]